MEGAGAKRMGLFVGGGLAVGHRGGSRAQAGGYGGDAAGAEFEAEGHGGSGHIYEDDIPPAHRCQTRVNSAQSENIS